MSPEMVEKIAHRISHAQSANESRVGPAGRLSARQIGQPRMIEQLASDIPIDDKLQVALYARFLPDWTTTQKLDILKFYEKARAWPAATASKAISTTSRAISSPPSPTTNASLVLDRRRQVAQLGVGRAGQIAARHFAGNHSANHHARQANVQASIASRPASSASASSPCLARSHDRRQPTPICTKSTKNSPIAAATLPRR